MPATMAFISLGSNQGDSRQTLRAALDAIAALPGVQLAMVSPVYSTEPQGYADQPFFYNQAAGVSCSPETSAPMLLRGLLDIETTLGRTRLGAERFGPRVIDLDLLLFGKELCRSEFLTLPHPRMLQRAFVLVPLADIAPTLELENGLTPKTALAALRYRREKNTLYQDA